MAYSSMRSLVSLLISVLPLKALDMVEVEIFSFLARVFIVILSIVHATVAQTKCCNKSPYNQAPYCSCITQALVAATVNSPAPTDLIPFSFTVLPSTAIFRGPGGGGGGGAGGRPGGGAGRGGH